VGLTEVRRLQLAVFGSEAHGLRAEDRGGAAKRSQGDR
jgi:hypothetical protein